MLHLTTTCPDLETARSLAADALEARLAACANITPGVLSLFHWDGAVQEEEEVQVTFKTTPARLDDLVALIEADHPYDLPVITWEEVGCTEEVDRWLTAETGG